MDPDGGVPVATAAAGTSHAGPAGAAWLPAASRGQRLRLPQLAPPGTAALTASTESGVTAEVPPGLPWHPRSFPACPGHPVRRARLTLNQRAEGPVPSRRSPDLLVHTFLANVWPRTAAR